VAQARIRALVVDDDHDIGEMVRLALTDEGYEVVLTANGSDALAATLDNHFDVILLDMRMPIMDGWSFADEYRTQPGPHAPVIVVTAARDAADRAAEIAADGYLSKPFSLDELFDVLHQHVRQP
jgi:two-component system, chemotaxis family, chemotaxis protein CheY